MTGGISTSWCHWWSNPKPVAQAAGWVWVSFHDFAAFCPFTVNFLFHSPPIDSWVGCYFKIAWFGFIPFASMDRTPEVEAFGCPSAVLLSVSGCGACCAPGRTYHCGAGCCKPLHACSKRVRSLCVCGCARRCSSFTSLSGHLVYICRVLRGL